MAITWKAQDSRYFWSNWFTGVSLSQLAITFVLLSLADFLATVRLMSMGLIKEGNTLADTVWHQHGVAGFAVYKLALVLLVITIIQYVHHKNPSLAGTVLWGGILIMGLVALRHLAIITGLTV